MGIVSSRNNDDVSLVGDLFQDPITKSVGFYDRCWKEKRGKAEKIFPDYAQAQKHLTVGEYVLANPTSVPQLQSQLEDAHWLLQFKQYIPHLLVDETDATQVKDLAPTIAFGDVVIPVSFKNGNSGEDYKSLSRKYLLLHDESSPEKVWQLLTNKWNLSRPNLLFSLITGNLEEPDMLKPLVNCIGKICANSKAWVISDGMHKGASLAFAKEVQVLQNGESICDRDITMIGISDWNDLGEEKALLYGASLSGWYESYYFYPKEFDLLKEEVDDMLNPFQNVYLLEHRADGKDSGLLGINLVKHMWKSCAANEESKYEGSAFLPTVSIVIGGDEAEETKILSQIEQCLLEKLPVVIVSNSGEVPERLKSIFVKMETVQRRSTTMAPALTAEEEKALEAEVQSLSAEKKNMLLTIMENRCYLTFIELEEDQCREADIIASFYKGKKHNECVASALVVGSLNLFKAAWLREVDVANDDHMCHVDHGELKELHALTWSKSEGLASVLFSENFEHNKQQDDPLSVVSLALYLLLGSRYKLQCFDDYNFSNQLADKGNQIWHLLLYSILSNKSIDLVTYLITLTKSPLGALVFAYKIYNAMSLQAFSSLEHELEDMYSAYAKRCLDTAVATINQMYKEDRIKAYRSLNRRLPFDLGPDVTVLSLAAESDAKTMIITPCCQTYINGVWMGGIKPSFWRRMVALLIPLIGWMFLPRISGFNVGTINADEFQANRGRNRCLNRLHKMFHNLKLFYSAPVTKFWFDLVCYVIFLGVFPHFLVSRLQPIRSISEITAAEWIVYFCLVGRILEEIIQMFGATNADSHSSCSKSNLKSSVWPFKTRFFLKSRFYKIKLYLSEGTWNVLDSIMSILLLVSIVCRFTVPQTDFQVVRFLFCITLLLYFTRSLRYLYIFPQIGPRVIAITMMLSELAKFCLILIVFHIGFGVAFQALLAPGQPPSGHVVADIVYRTYWQMYGELFLDDAETGMGRDVGPYGCEYLKMNGQPNLNCYGTFPYLLLGVYLFISNVLLLNALIAIFGNTLNSVEEKSGIHWAHERYVITREYYHRCWLPAPFNLIWYPILICWNLFQYLRRKIKKELPEKVNYEDHFLLEELPDIDYFQFNALKTAAV